VFDAAAICYYAVTSDAITTVAHVCALAMGATFALFLDADRRRRLCTLCARQYGEAPEYGRPLVPAATADGPPTPPRHS
jgi:hypothetical protein